MRYRPNEDLSLYASAARGTRSGGVNALITDPAFVEFEPELNNTFELGVKAALGYSDPEFDSGTYAASLEPLCRPMLTGTATTVAQIPVRCVTRTIGASTRTQPDISGYQLLRTSKMTGTFGVEYSRPILGDSNLSTRLDASYRSKQYSDFINASWAPARTIANLRVRLERERYDIVLWFENLADEDAPEQLAQNGSTALAGSIAYSSVSILPVQRRYGITGRFRL